jgi:hypothetical protein
MLRMIVAHIQTARPPHDPNRKPITPTQVVRAIRQTIITQNKQNESGRRP